MEVEVEVFEELLSLETVLESGPFLVLDFLWEDLLGDFAAIFWDESFLDADFSGTSKFWSEPRTPNRQFTALVSG